MITKTAALLFLAVLLAGCATHQKLTYTGGSKADGIVKLSYGYRLYQNPNVDPVAGRQTALAKCQAWGYTDVKPSGRKTAECIRQSKIACDITYVTVEYQCVGRK